MSVPDHRSYAAASPKRVRIIPIPHPIVGRLALLVFFLACVHQPCLLLIEVPTKTTCTAANAVVAAKQSTLLALAMRERTRLKRSEKAAIAVMRASGLWIKYRAKIGKVGRRE